MLHELPKTHPLRFADVVIGLFDRIARSKGLPANVCGLELCFSAEHDSFKRIQSRLSESQLIRWLSCVRVGRKGFRKIWQCGTDSLAVETVDRDDYQSLKAGSFRNSLGKESAFKCFVLRESSETKLFIVWHHALFDALGLQNFIFSVLGEIEVPAGSFFVKEKFPKLFAIKKGRRISLAALRAPFRVVKGSAAYSQLRIDFSLAETEQILQFRQKLKLDLFPGIFYQSVVLKALEQFVEVEDAGFLLLSPHNIRKRKNRSALGNFVNLSVSRVASEGASLTLLSEKLLADNYSMIQAGSMKAMADFQSVFSLLPAPIAQALLLYPGGGAMATAYVSCLEGRRSDVPAPADLSCTNVIHHPPHFYPPGFSVVFHTFRDELRVIVSSAMKQERARAFCTQIRSLLLEQSK